MIDFSIPPEVEYDDDKDSPSLTLSWFAPGKRTMFTLTVWDGRIVGCHSSLDIKGLPRPWGHDIPNGLLRIAAPDVDEPERIK